MVPIRPSEVKAWCIERDFHPNRTLGQNFLIDRNILEAIAAAAGLPPRAAVLEVGPGLGAMTQALLEADNVHDNSRAYFRVDKMAEVPGL